MLVKFIKVIELSVLIF
uniref:Uncharacterized protein n=1 Tax=Rhizophora mucronata TaxID=61149 RepID=A0A2P2NVW9_RHIMU